jgi:hypothetical protein
MAAVGFLFVRLRHTVNGVPSRPVHGLFPVRGIPLRLSSSTMDASQARRNL